MTTKLVVFNLPDDCRENEVEDIFGKFGKLTRTAVRQTRNNDVMAFIEFEDARDADDARRERHGYQFDGRRLRVEFSNPGGSKGGSSRRDSRGRGRRSDSRRRSRGRGKH